MQSYVFIDEVPLEPLDKITGVNIKPGIDFVDISWDHQNDIDHYALTVNDETYIQTENNLSILNLNPDTTYSVRLISVAGELQSPAYIDHFTTLPLQPTIEFTQPVSIPPPIEEPILQPIHLWSISAILVIILLIIFLVIIFSDNSPDVPGLQNIL